MSTVRSRVGGMTGREEKMEGARAWAWARLRGVREGLEGVGWVRLTPLRRVVGALTVADEDEGGRGHRMRRAVERCEARVTTKRRKKGMAPTRAVNCNMTCYRCFLCPFFFFGGACFSRVCDVSCRRALCQLGSNKLPCSLVQTRPR